MLHLETRTKEELKEEHKVLIRKINNSSSIVVESNLTKELIAVEKELRIRYNNFSW